MHRGGAGVPRRGQGHVAGVSHLKVVVRRPWQVHQVLVQVGAERGPLGVDQRQHLPQRTTEKALVTRGAQGREGPAMRRTHRLAHAGHVQVRVDVGQRHLGNGKKKRRKK